MIKQMAKKGDVRTCKILAKELVRSRRQKDRIVTSKAQLNSISMQLQHQLCNVINPLPSPTLISKTSNISNTHHRLPHTHSPFPLFAFSSCSFSYSSSSSLFETNMLPPPPPFSSSTKKKKKKMRAGSVHDMCNANLDSFFSNWNKM